MECYYLNVGGLGTKLKDHRSAIQLYDYSVIILVETWLNDTFLLGEIAITTIFIEWIGN